MSRLAEIRARLRAMTDIQGILRAMKNISIIETAKVSRFIEAQVRLEESVSRAIADFESFYGPERVARESQLRVLIGSERGFCGAFNERVAQRLAEEASSLSRASKVFVVGRKLFLKLESDPRLAGWVPGPSSADEVAGVVENMGTQLLPFSDQRWLIVFNDAGEGGPRSKVISPFDFEPPARPPGPPRGHAPLLNVPPRDLYPRLLEQRLSAVLFRTLYVSFLAENRERLRHMEAALNRIDKEIDRLASKSNTARQEAITEELEVLLLK